MLEVLIILGELRNLVSIFGRQSDNGISLEQVCYLLFRVSCRGKCKRKHLALEVIILELVVIADLSHFLT